jgi:hypothetical protein
VPIGRSEPDCHCQRGIPTIFEFTQLLPDRHISVTIAA